MLPNLDQLHTQEYDAGQDTIYGVYTAPAVGKDERRRRRCGMQRVRDVGRICCWSVVHKRICFSAVMWMVSITDMHGIWRRECRRTSIKQHDVKRYQLFCLIDAEDEAR